MKKPAHHKMTSRSPIYIYATEMVSAYYKCLDLKDKSVLSICGSGDQVINAYFFGAKKVFAFDINIRAEFILDLKLKALKILDYEEFLDFFGSGYGNAKFSFSNYQKIRSSLLDKTKRFFDKVYKEFNYNGRRLVDSDYFRKRDMLSASIFQVNAYLKNEKEYLKCRNIMADKKIEFVVSDINEINKKINKTFDIINISNVLNYLTANVADGDLVRILSLTIKSVSKKLKVNGLIFWYSYFEVMYKNNGKGVPPASRKDIIKEIEKNLAFKIISKKIKGMKQGFFDRINILMRVR
ncbi:MAG: DUF3419 family protein [Patescibacteria group bacterium]|jgi:S-adenosylmethionine-diacylglycerol 3-amino-3-carboxypropyl transferase